MEELKPCPFCGGAPALENTEVQQIKNKKGDFITSWTVQCTTCKISKSSGMPEYQLIGNGTFVLTDENYDGRKQAIDKWNTRQTKAGESVGELKLCPFCGEEAEFKEWNVLTDVQQGTFCTHFEAICSKCAARKTGKTLDGVTTGWNRRTI